MNLKPLLLYLRIIKNNTKSNNLNKPQTMNNREEAIKRCNNLEKELAELKKTLSIPVNIMDRVKSFEDACQIKCINSNDFIQKLRSVGLSESSIAHEKLCIIAEVLNEGKVLDWTNINQYKYFPWFRVGDSSGSGFADHGYHYQSTTTAVASRLCFHSSELALFAGKTFLDIYKDYITIQ